MNFDYNEAFKRNLGLVTAVEQQLISSKTIAIAGMGGVGGSHLLTLVRMGFQRFHIADMDYFELANFNRQAGASLSSVGKSKVEVMKAQALDINPHCKITVFEQGVATSNIDAFLEGVDVYVDALDFFVFAMRANIFAKCKVKGITAITAGPIGISTAYLVFSPDKMSFEEYFQFAGKTPFQQAINFLVGLTPRLPQRKHFVDPRYINLSAQRGSSLAPACVACSAVMSAEVMKIVLGRGQVRYAPWAMQFDMYFNRYHTVYNWLGNRNPINWLRIRLLRKLLANNNVEEVVDEPTHPNVLHAILDLAKWAPSGDNSQPWFIRLRSHNTFSLDLTKFKQNTYNLLPIPDYASIGMFLQTAAIAAQQQGLDVTWQVDGDTVNATLIDGNGKQPSSLYPYIKLRSVNRNPYKRTALPKRVKDGAAQLLDDDMQIFWLDRASERLSVAKLLCMATDIRLRIPETYDIHHAMVDWSGTDSPDRMPADALGMNPLSTTLMKWALAGRERNRTLMKLPGATLALQLELDMIPALMCATHFVMCFDHRKTPTLTPEDYIRAGAAMQRFWLYLTSQLQSLQPWYTPLMFSRYVQAGITFTQDHTMQAKAARLHDRLIKTILAPRHIELDHVFFSGRVGLPKKVPAHRSIRKPLDALIVDDVSGEHSPSPPI